MHNGNYLLINIVELQVDHSQINRGNLNLRDLNNEQRLQF